jgi:hypothetical protein
MNRFKLHRIGLAAVFLALLLAMSGCVVAPARPAGGVAVQYDYYYYPDADVYYSISTGFYYYYSRGAWLRVRTLPRHYRLNPRHRVRIEAPRHRPYQHHREHRRTYRPQPRNDRNRERNHNRYPEPYPDRDRGRYGNHDRYPGGNHGRDERRNHNGQPGGMPGPDTRGPHRNGSPTERGNRTPRDSNTGRYQRHVKPSNKTYRNGRRENGNQKGKKDDKNGKNQKDDDNSKGLRPAYR